MIQVLVDHRGLGQNRFFSYRWPEPLKVGTLVKVPFGRQSLLGFVVPEQQENSYTGETKELIDVLLELNELGKEIWEVIRWLRYSCRVGWVTCLRTVFPTPVRKQLLKSGSLTTKRAHRLVEGLVEERAMVSNLTHYQEQALKQIDASPHLFQLLHGVTGSGKTEIYLRLCKEQAHQGRVSLVLVPEVSLTPQIWGRFEQAFPGKLAVLHSGLTEAQRRNQWLRCYAEEVKVVLGTRSAVFAPVKKLGIIILDEEHDQSYKNLAQPYYHARQIAYLRSRFHTGLKVVLGSATPSIESYYEAQKGDFELVKLPERVTGQNLPAVHFINTQVEKPAYGRLLSPPLIKALQANFDRQEQSLLLLNRRGYFGVITCSECSWKAECPSCSVALTYYRRKNTLQCHYCGVHRKVPDLCPTCSSPLDSGYRGGTEMLEEELKEVLPGVRVARMDRDNVTNFSQQTAMLTELKNASIDVLIGTQMVAKGLDFPNITLVGVIGGDDTLNLPDFRASERTFQLLAQVAGRAGRGEKSGRVLIQVRDLNHASVTCAAHHDYQGFYTQEIGWRSAAGYPPIQRLVKIGIEGKSEEKVGKVAEKLAGLLLKNAQGSQVVVLGPSVCAIAKIKNLHRWQCLLKGSKLRDCLSLVHQSLSALPEKEVAMIRVDPDPVDML